MSSITTCSNNSAAAAAYTTGFICPDCKPNAIAFPSEELLLKHWIAFHDDQSRAARAIAAHAGRLQEVYQRKHVFVDASAHGKACRICGTRMWRSILQCKDCRFQCHVKCAELVHHLRFFSCFKCVKARERRDCPGFMQSSNRLIKSIRKVVTGKKVRYVTEMIDLDLTYITPRIIAMSFPASGLEATYRNNLKDVAGFLNAKHGSQYMIFNVSEKEYDISQFENQVLDFGWPDHMAPPLERLCSICNSIDSWLEADPDNVCVVHCKGGKGRTGVIVAAYLSYKRLFTNAEDAMNQFRISRFEASTDSDEVGITNPSQRRYVRYFEDVLDRRLQVYHKHLVLEKLVVQTIPSFDKQGGCRPLIEICENLTKEVYRSREPLSYFAASAGYMEIDFSQGVHLEGDVSIKFFHKSSRGHESLVFRVQFPTCAIGDDSVTFERHELDHAYKDKRVSPTMNVTFFFRKMSDAEKMIAEADSQRPMASVSLLLSRRDSNDHISLRNSSRLLSSSKLLSSSSQSHASTVETTASFRDVSVEQLSMDQSTVVQPQIMAESFPRSDTPIPPVRNRGHRRSSSLDPSNPFFSRSTPEAAFTGTFVEAIANLTTGRSPSRGLLTTRSSDSSPMLGRQSLARRRSSSFFEGCDPTASVKKEQDIERRVSMAADMSMPRAHENAQWFMGRMSKHAAEQLLSQKASNGQFIVCVAPDDVLRFYLYVRFEEQVISFNVAWEPQNRWFSLEDRAHFRDLNQLIAFYMSNTLTRAGDATVKLTTGFGTNGLVSRHNDVSHSLVRLHLVSRQSRQARTMSMCLTKGNTISEQDVAAMRRILGHET